MTKEEMMSKLDVIIDKLDARLCDPSLDEVSYDFEMDIYERLLEIAHPL